MKILSLEERLSVRSVVPRATLGATTNIGNKQNKENKHVRLSRQIENKHRRIVPAIGQPQSLRCKPKPYGRLPQPFVVSKP